MRVIIACSGAGGHFSAGLSIAEELKKRISNIKLFFLSSDNIAAKRLAECAGYKFHRIYSRGLLGNTVLSIVQFFIGQAIGFFQAVWLLVFIRPNVVVSTGGFATVGIVCWSRLFGIPIIIHEQNIIPGKANRLLSPLADKILISFNDSKQYFENYDYRLTGMPIESRKKLDKKTARSELGLDINKFTILIMGGSKGAHSINQLVMDSIRKIHSYRDRIQFIHLAGISDYKQIKEIYRQFGFNAYVETFSMKMDIIYNSTNLIISRAGSSSISEIAYFGLPSILIPYPYSQDKHQLKNASGLSSKNAAIVIEENELSSDKLINIVVKLINEPERLNKMAEQSRSLSTPNAACEIVDEVQRLLNPAPLARN